MLHVFTGPTLPADRVLALAPDASVYPPAQHGDLLRLRLTEGDTALIIDGLWHQVPPVRHKEILELLAEGVTVAGAASMGALRAAELAPYGMIGLGWVYEQYASGRLDADDEVAVTQTPDGRPLSTALVCLRHAIESAASEGVLDGRDSEALLGLARELPYQRRSWRALEYAATDAGHADAYCRLAGWHEGNPGEIKTLDAEAAVRMAASGLPAAAVEGWQTAPWRTSHLRGWVAAHRPAAAASDAHVPLVAVLHHAQLYDPQWPVRWRRHVLAWIASQQPTNSLPVEILEDRALAAARLRGLTLGSLSASQVEYWATPAEAVGLSCRELLLRVLVRSARLDPTAQVWPETPAEAEGLLDVEASARAAVEAWEVNQQVAATGAARTTAHLDPARLAAHLAEQWGLVPNDETALTAAARDRGILSFAEAVETARPFYLAARRL